MAIGTAPQVLSDSPGVDVMAGSIKWELVKACAPLALVISRYDVSRVLTGLAEGVVSFTDRSRGCDGVCR